MIYEKVFDFIDDKFFTDGVSVSASTPAANWFCTFNRISASGE
jgi:hypothetical protein